MHISLLFWLALALPGYVIVRFFYKEDLACGLLGTLGLSYLAALGLLSPISIACYVLELPLLVFSMACLLIIFAAPIEISRRGWWPEVGKLLLAGLTLEFLVVAIDLAMGARVGSFLSGDAQVHLGRIRFLLSHGLTNQDSYVAAKSFYAIYHTNLFHALFAACSQLTRLDPLDVWVAGLTWSKLLTASGVYYLAWTLFGRRWPAWTAAMFIIGERALSPFLLYPNQLAPQWLTPFAIAFVIQACQGTCSWRMPLKIGAASLLLGQFHGLYAVFAALALLPTLLVVTLVKLRSGMRRNLWLALCIPAISVGLAFPVVSRSQNRAFQARGEDTGASKSVTAETKQRTRAKSSAFRYLDNGQMAMKPGWGWAGSRLNKHFGWMRHHRYYLFGAGFLLAFAGRRRRHVAPLLGITATIFVALYYPPVCTFLVAQFKEEWIVTRLPVLLKVLLYAIFPGAVVYVLEQRLRIRWWMRSVFNVGLVFGVTQYCWQQEPFTWARYTKRALGSINERHREYVFMMNTRSFLKESLPPGETVLMDPDIGMLLTSLHDCRLVAAARTNAGVQDQGRRMKDLQTMLQDETPWTKRVELLRKYRVEYFVPGSPKPRWVDGHVVKTWRSQFGVVLHRLRTDGE